MVMNNIIQTQLDYSVDHVLAEKLKNVKLVSINVKKYKIV